MHRIGVISDTHGLLRPEVLEKLKDCDAILHAGDIDKQHILDELTLIAPVYAVRGNADKSWAEKLPETLSLDLFGIKIFMTHNKKMINENADGLDVLIYGHSHKYEEKYNGRQLWLNPGSCGPRRFTLPIMMAILEITEDGSFRVTKVELPQDSRIAEKMTGKQMAQQTRMQVKGLTEEKDEKYSADLRQIIEVVIKEVDRGKTVKDIAKKNKMDEKLAEQICRLYLTHPGVDADGIMTKMGL